MSPRERRRVLVLGLPAFGMALAITAVSTYLPVLVRQQQASTVVIGTIIGAEGLMALWVPVLVGDRSDRLRTRVGGRLPFLIVGAPLMAACLCVVGFVHSVALMGGLIALFFLGYFMAYSPYRALYPDLVGDELAGRSQSVQAAWRGLGTGLALLGGGFLLAAAHFLPFVAAAGLLVLSLSVFVLLLLRRGYAERARHSSVRRDGPSRPFRHVWSLLRERPGLRLYLVANALWELTLGAIKTFVVLYVTAGLGYSLDQASLIIGGVAVVVLVGALCSGWLGDRYGRTRVVEAGLWVYGLCLLAPAVTTKAAAILPAVLLVALCGGMLMSLPYSLLMPLMPDDEHGALTGLYSVSRGLGVMLGPLLAGLAISLGKPIFASTDGYAAAWWVAGIAALLSLAPLRRLRRRMSDS
ncbi:MAG TPA: MFS transporter [Solirubrobacterales bacterium]|nr:MFS transporter [Solirubrobacterales bacterium]